MTDTTVLNAMMRMLDRNTRQSQLVDDRPFYSRKEPVSKRDMRRPYAEVIDVFHHDLTAPRQERGRMGTCPSCGTETVQAVETRIAAAMRVDGRCLTCGWLLHRAGWTGKRG